MKNYDVSVMIIHNPNLCLSNLTILIEILLLRVYDQEKLMRDLT